MTFPFDSRVILWGETRGQLLFYIMKYLGTYLNFCLKKKGGALGERRMFHLGGGGALIKK